MGALKVSFKSAFVFIRPGIYLPSSKRVSEHRILGHKVILISRLVNDPRDFHLRAVKTYFEFKQRTAKTPGAEITPNPFTQSWVLSGVTPHKKRADFT